MAWAGKWMNADGEVSIFAAPTYEKFLVDFSKIIAAGEIMPDALIDFYDDESHLFGMEAAALLLAGIHVCIEDAKKGKL